MRDSHPARSPRVESGCAAVAGEAGIRRYAGTDIRRELGEEDNLLYSRVVSA